MICSTISINRHNLSIHEEFKRVTPVEGQRRRQMADAKSKGAAGFWTVIETDVPELERLATATPPPGSSGGGGGGGGGGGTLTGARGAAQGQISVAKRENATACNSQSGRPSNGDGTARSKRRKSESQSPPSTGASSVRATDKGAAGTKAEQPFDTTPTNVHGSVDAQPDRQPNTPGKRKQQAENSNVSQVAALLLQLANQKPVA